MAETEKSLRVIFFSPTGTTRNIVRAIARGCGFENVVESDLTTPQKRAQFNPVISEDLVIIAMPVYEEHIPREIEPILTTIAGNGTLMAGVAVYGNIGFGMSLKDLYQLAETVGLTPVAFGAFIGEHSFARPDIPVALNRPSESDLAEAEAFGQTIVAKINDGSRSFPEEEIPGHLPFMARILPSGSARWFTKTPLINSSCNNCNACIALCPMGAISYDLSVDDSKCIRCFACTKRCPKEGRSIELKKSFMVKNVLKRGNRVRKENLILHPR